MNPDNLVAIWVEGEGAHYSRTRIATGYAISHNRILTVAHPIREGWTTITVRFLFSQETERDSKIIQAAQTETACLAWHGRFRPDVGLDVALLVCPFPEDILADAEFVTQRPRMKVDWSSRCFPNVLRQANSAPKKSFDPAGDYVPEEVGPNNRLTVSGQRPVIAEDWQGASGAPIFFSDRIAGVFCGYETKSVSRAAGGDAHKELAWVKFVPAWNFLPAAGFGNALHDAATDFEENDERWFRTIARRIAAAISKHDSDAVKDAVQDSLGVDAEKSVEELRRQLQAVVSASAADRSLPAKLLALCDSCREDEEFDAEETFFDLLVHAIPTVFTVDERIAIARRLQTRVEVTIQVAFPAGAAVTVAAIDRKQLDDDGLLDRVSNVEQWTGRSGRSLQDVELGEMEATQLAIRMFDELAADILPPEVRDDIVQAHVELRNGKASQENVEKLEQDCLAKARFVNRQFEHTADRIGMSFCVFQVPTEELRAVFAGAIDRLSEWLPALRFIELGGLPENWSDGEAVAIPILRTYADRKSRKTNT